MAVGRPSKYIAEYVEQAVKLCRLGATDADLADFFKVDITTIAAWSARYPEFSGAMKMNKGVPDDLMERSLYMKGRGFWITTEKVFCSNGNVTKVEVREYYPPDTAAAFIWLKNRRPHLWRDKHEVIHSGSIDHTHQLTDLTNSPNDEVQREYAEALGLAAQVQQVPPAALN